MFVTSGPNGNGKAPIVMIVNLARIALGCFRDKVLTQEFLGMAP
jgi:hypothetical protein